MTAMGYRTYCSLFHSSISGIQAPTKLHQPPLNPLPSRNPPALLHIDSLNSDVMFSIAQSRVPLPHPEPPPECPCPSDDEDDNDQMADLLVLVEDISSDKESDNDQYSYLSTSSTESYNDKLKALYDDHDSGTRWINQSIAAPPWTSEVNIRNAEALNDIDKSQYPAG